VSVFDVCLHLLAGLPAAVSSPGNSAAKAASPATSWALRALKQNSSKQTHMLEALLMQHLQKQLLLVGNPVIVPVLGHQCVFRSASTSAVKIGPADKCNTCTYAGLHHFGNSTPTHNITDYTHNRIVGQTMPATC